MVKVSAPGKIILFGEHAVVYGECALAIAIDLRITVDAAPAGTDKFTVNGYELNEARHKYMKCAVERFWHGEPLRFILHSELPTASGLGSSAALTTATLGALCAIEDDFAEEKIAKRGFEVEYEVQGSASPIDTTTSTHGSGILVAGEALGEGLLWSISRRIKGKETKWFMHECTLPDLTFVIGDTKIPSNTGEQVAKVRQFVEGSPYARDIIKEIGELVLEGVKALEDEDFSKIGSLMNDNHRLLSLLGVNTPQLQRLVSAALPYAYGAKLTGAGGGGSIIALTEDPESAANSIIKSGGRVYIVKMSRRGVAIEI
jgi:mevalonate kinase